MVGMFLNVDTVTRGLLIGGGIPLLATDTTTIGVKMMLVAFGVSLGLIFYKKKVLGHNLDLADAFLIPGAGAGVGILYLLLAGNPLSSIMTAAVLIPILAGLAVLGLVTKLLIVAK